MRIYELVLEPDREEHIARHGVSVMEAEEVALGQHVVFRTRHGRYALLGETEAGRCLKLIVASRGRGVYGLVTARDASEAEHRLFRRYS